VYPALPFVLHPGQAYRFAWQRRVVIGQCGYERPLILDRPAQLNHAHFVIRHHLGKPSRWESWQRMTKDYRDRMHGGYREQEMLTLWAHRSQHGFPVHIVHTRGRLPVKYPAVRVRF
jgi:hypothetical protein